MDRGCALCLAQEILAGTSRVGYMWSPVGTRLFPRPHRSWRHHLQVNCHTSEYICSFLQFSTPMAFSRKEWEKGRREGGREGTSLAQFLLLVSFPSFSSSAPLSSPSFPSSPFPSFLSFPFPSLPFPSLSPFVVLRIYPRTLNRLNHVNTLLLSISLAFVFRDRDPNSDWSRTFYTV